MWLIVRNVKAENLIIFRSDSEIAAQTLPSSLALSENKRRTLMVSRFYQRYQRHISVL